MSRGGSRGSREPSPDGRRVATSSLDGSLRLWHGPTWRELGTARQGSIFTYLEIVDGGRTLLAGEYRGDLKVDRTEAPR